MDAHLDRSRVVGALNSLRRLWRGEFALFCVALATYMFQVLAASLMAVPD